MDLPLRDLLMVMAFAALVPLAMTRTWIAVLLWTWVSMMNPHRLTYGFAHDLPFAMVVALAAFCSLLVDRRRLHLPMHSAIVCLLLFILWTVATTATALLPEPSTDQLIKVLKIQAMTLVAVAAIRERKHIEAFLAVNAFSIGFYGFKGGIFTLTTGGSGRVWGPPGGFVEGNNELGLALVMTIPLLYYFYEGMPKGWWKRALGLGMVLCALSALGTQSRGAFLAITAMTLVLWSRSQRKGLMFLVLALLSCVLILFMPDSWTDRMQSIQTYEADGSAMGRINAWWMAFNLANDRFMGAGFQATSVANFAKYAPIPDDVHAAHSIYFQVLGEHGWLGLLLFMGIGWFTWRECARLRRLTRGHLEAGWIYRLAGLLQVSMVGYAVGGAFLSLAYFDMPYNVMVIVIACRYWLAEERWKLQPALKPSRYAPTRMQRFKAWLA